METKLFNYIKTHFFDNALDFKLEHNQKFLENLWENKLQLNEEYLKNIYKYLNIYNKFLREKWEKEISLRYYQILALYYSEVYFENKDLKDFESFSKNSLAYWMATWSGKTIVMHLNILQYLEKLESFSKLQVILTTPWTNLIDQHINEIVPFLDYLNKKYSNKIEYIIDTTSSLLQKGANYYSLNWNKKIKRIILVDEAHIWVSSQEEWKFYTLRNELNKENSFLFEYSATFHNLHKSIEKEYENQIVYDYNYNLFYWDWYWKDYAFKQIWEDVLAWENFEEIKKNIDECLNVTQDKLHIWRELKDYNSQKQMALFGDVKMFPNKPLITFMGNSVSWEESDVKDILLYFSSLKQDEKKKYDNIFNFEIDWKLHITRIRWIEDELLLSFWDTWKYFWIVNVWGWDSFFSSIENPNIIKKSIDIIDSKYLFKNIDKKESPINVLIWSRKFSEGWNSFRVSVIALINIWKSEWNKIIQIFGRGVRLKWLNNDWKRKYKEHNENYYSLLNSNNEHKLKKLETLNVLSLKRSYLETFTNKIKEEITHTFTFKLEVKINNAIKLWDKEIQFDDYSKRLPIFKLSKKQVEQKIIYIKRGFESIWYIYNEENQTLEWELNNFNFNLDYRTNRDNIWIDIKESFKQKVIEYRDYIDILKIKKIINDFSIENMLKIYNYDETSTTWRQDFDYILLFNFINEIKYDSNFEINNISLIQIEKLLIKLLREFLSKLKNKINHQINSKNIVFWEKLSQRKDWKWWDFLEYYNITKVFDNEEEKNTYISNIENEKQNIINTLSYTNIFNHIYHPLFKENSTNDINISPDTLNVWEIEFIQRLNNSIIWMNSNLEENEKDRYEFYLMRNVESLRSIWVYLEDEEAPFFHDFIFWIIDNEEKKIFINLVDPKGQDWIIDRVTLKFNSKARIWNKKWDSSKTLQNIEEKLNQNKNNIDNHYKWYDIKLNSFIMLVRTSELWNNLQDNDTIQLLKNNNVYRLDWEWENDCILLMIQELSKDWLRDLQNKFKNMDVSFLNDDEDYDKPRESLKKKKKDKS